MARSKRYSVLHFPGGVGFTPSRGKFLDGTWKAYFAPGQPATIEGGYGVQHPAASWAEGNTFTQGDNFDPYTEDWYIDQLIPIQTPDAPDSSDAYANPTDWNKAGTLLRPPQVVWLEIRFGSAINTAFDPLTLFSAGSAEVIHGSDHDVPWDDVVLVDADTLWLPNPGRAEHIRLAPIFSAAKTRIESLRQGKTFVVIQNWCVESRPLTSEFFPGTEDWVATINGNEVVGLDDAGRATGAGFIHAPVKADRFFGTDFFHIYCGDAIIQNTYMNFIYTLPPHIAHGEPYYPISPTALASQPYWQAAYARLKLRRPLFYGHSTRLYSLAADTWPDWWNVTGVVIESQINLPSLAVFSATPDNFDQAASIAAVDKIDLTHVGLTSVVTEDYLVNLIADHFKFDPQTGKDL